MLIYIKIETRRVEIGGARNRTLKMWGQEKGRKCITDKVLGERWLEERERERKC